jgi:DNA-binding transcriptional MerR regulator
MSKITIGNLAAATGAKVRTIRYYEQIGLIRPFGRTEGGHRIYGAEDLHRLTFIRHARELGFSTADIRELLELSDNPDTSCSLADRIAQRQLENVESRIEKLNALRGELRRMLDQCSHERAGDCRVIEVLSDHRHCAADH